MPYKDEIFGWTAPQYAKNFRRNTDYVPRLPSAAVDGRARGVPASALEKAGTLDPKKVRDAIAKTNIKSFYGNVCFNEKGEETCKSMGIAQVQNGKAVVVWPAKYATRKLIYPAPGFEKGVHPGRPLARSGATRDVPAVS